MSREGVIKTLDDQPVAGAAADVYGALRRAGIAGLLALGLFLPTVGLVTVQDISNKLILTTSIPLLLWLVFVVMFGRFVLSFIGDRRWWLISLAGIAVALYGAFEVLNADDQVSLKARTALVAIGVIIAVAADFFTERRKAIARDFGAGIGAVLRQPATGYVLLGAVIAYPLVMLAIHGPGGSIKWIDNYGIQILIYIMLGWGLNIVVGLAGLLDLGYVAFYAVGAYSYGLLSTQFGLSFWILLPLSGILAAFWGVILGFPVLRLRGDYLAIVTLAFGEIVRLVLINWKDFSNGYEGISGIPRPTFFGLPFNASDSGFAAFFGLPFSPIYRTIFLFYLILAMALVTAAVTLRLRRLPIGRAWEALREDEIACRSLGINTTKTKLTAFAIGAMFGGFAGAFFAARQGFISPESFVFTESATILAIVVLGGSGSLVGVVIAAFVLQGGFEFLRELDFLKQIFGADFDPTKYRALLFGAGMVVMMLWKPRGLISHRTPTAFLKERKTVSADLVKEGHG
ncbi:high-affinity branched-chain amino acid ABC transporter permease LivM [Labrys wisconsinensis]|uniref:Branched-chain amino acid transport system permease protein n=1 Tax=Labrys wisconsinensis TaxID=425677 RepID=A0ABU0JKU2_9HYPH|nr:high-affinity branched-chain amino acid ABC transporter permease LivM [Labrys wisconsinensis]MDQ0474904.1 branched-chain amino acid transport system permease protein [Labrys wisconsinensis]